MIVRLLDRHWKVAIPFVLAILMAVSGAPSSVAQNAASPANATPEATEGSSALALPSFAIYPKETGPRTFFDVVQDAGTKKNYTVVLINAGSPKQGSFRGLTFAANVRTKVNGGLESGGPTDEKTGTTTWLDYPNDEVKLEPGKGIERTFTVTVPKDTPPGQYITALCFETADPIAVPGVPNLKQNLRQTIAFYVTVPGEIHPQFSIEDIRIASNPTWSGVEAKIVNSGNVLVRPEGRITVNKPDGTPFLTNEISFGAFYAGQTGIIQTGFSDRLPAGDYLVTIELRDPDTGAKAIVENQQIATTTGGDITAQEAPPVAFSAVSGKLEPNSHSPQFLNVSATISNSGDAVEDAQLSLRATRDGKLIENYVVVSPLALPTGETDVSTRYVPVGGWQSGTWTFSLNVETLDRQTGIAQVLATISLGDPVTIPKS